MKKKEFKSSSKRVLDLMINSIYTNKEIFLRELLSNASDAIDKLVFTSLTDSSVSVNRDDLKIVIERDKDARVLKISDNGIGMDEAELEHNLGTIAESGSFKKSFTSSFVSHIGSTNSFSSSSCSVFTKSGKSIK